MDIYFIPFQDQFLIYRPLLPLGFVGNLALVHHIQERLAGRCPPASPEADELLEQLGFWQPDPPAPDEWTPADDHRPTAGVLLMTSACNLRCTYCYAFGGEGPLRQMTLPLAQTVIDTVFENARSRRVDRFSLTFHGGGEPTANWDVLTGAVRYAKRKDLPCDVTMSTNGVLSREKVDFVVRNFSGVSLSFDGIRKVQDAQRPTPGGGSSFDAVVRTIGAFDRAGFPYGVRITVSPETFSSISRSVAFLCQETRCQGIQVEPTYTGQRGGHADPDAEQSEAFVQAFREAFEVACRYGRPLSYSGARPLVVSTAFCLAASHALVVTPEGKIVTCFEIHDESHPLAEQFTVGRVLPSKGAETLRLKNGLHSLTVVDLPRSRVEIDRQALRNYASEGHRRREDCRGCFCYWHCAGDCATRRSASVTATHGRCHVNREITKEVLAWYIAAGGGVWRGTHREPATVGPGLSVTATPNPSPAL